jgi:hypothetical protein
VLQASTFTAIEYTSVTELTASACALDCIRLRSANGRRRRRRRNDSDSMGDCSVDELSSFDTSSVAASPNGQQGTADETVTNGEDNHVTESDDSGQKNENPTAHRRPSSYLPQSIERVIRICSRGGERALRRNAASKNEQQQEAVDGIIGGSIRPNWTPADRKAVRDRHGRILFYYHPLVKNSGSGCSVETRTDLMVRSRSAAEFKSCIVVNGPILLQADRGRRRDEIRRRLAAADINGDREDCRHRGGSSTTSNGGSSIDDGDDDEESGSEFRRRSGHSAEQTKSVDGGAEESAAEAETLSEASRRRRGRLRRALDVVTSPEAMAAMTGSDDRKIATDDDGNEDIQKYSPEEASPSSPVDCTADHDSWWKNIPAERCRYGTAEDFGGVLTNGDRKHVSKLDRLIFYRLINGMVCLLRSFYLTTFNGAAEVCMRRSQYNINQLHGQEGNQSV